MDKIIDTAYMYSFEGEGKSAKHTLERVINFTKDTVKYKSIHLHINAIKSRNIEKAQDYFNFVLKHHFNIKKPLSGNFQFTHLNINNDVLWYGITERLYKYDNNNVCISVSKPQPIYEVCLFLPCLAEDYPENIIQLIKHLS